MISLFYYNLTIDILTLIIMGLVAAPFMFSRGKFGRINYTFMWGTVAAFVKSAADIVCEISAILSWSVITEIITSIISYFLLCIFLVFFAEYQLLVIKFPKKAEKAFIAILSIYYMIISVLNAIFMERFVFSALQILGLFAGCVVVLLYKKAPTKQRLSFAIFSVILSYGIIMAYFTGENAAVQIAILVGVCLLYINSYIENKNELINREAELTNSKMEVMISQIQPHFLYNSLSAAAALCHTDPDRAEETINNFGRYLRGNLDSLRRTEPVPFQQELRHIKAYVELEKTRLQEQLNVEYNIDISDFTLPALSVQPLVENAVKHGIAESGADGTVSIVTRDDENNIYIEVNDNGAGFDMANVGQDSAHHIGIENVQSRLASMMGGRLDITSAPGQGTKALITIPKKKVQ